MNNYGWTLAYVAAIEEHDRAELQKRIGEARKLMLERLPKLIGGTMADGNTEEFRSLRDARRALDLLERVSNDVDLLGPQEMSKSA